MLHKYRGKSYRMNFAKFIFFSSLEPLSFFYFVLVMFRFPIKEHLTKFAVVAVVLSLVSHALQTESLQAISPIVQAVLCILFASFFLRVRIIYSSIMVITGYVIYFVIQAVLLGLFSYFEIFTDIKPYTNSAYQVQAISAACMSIFTLIIWYKNGGFSFIDSISRFGKRKIFARENKWFVIFLSTSITVIFISNLLFQLMTNPPYLLISIFLIISMVVLISLSIQRDEQS